MNLIEFKVITDLKDFPKLDINKPLFADIETNGLYINPRLFQVYQKGDKYVYIFDLDYINLKDLLPRLFQYHTVWYNASYDLGTLDWVSADIDDLYYLVRLAYPNMGQYSLDSAVTKLGLDYIYQGIDKKQMQKSGFVNGAYLSHKQLLYSALDVYALSKLWDNELIQAQRKSEVYGLDIESLINAVIYQQNGLPVDKAEVQRLIKETEEKIKQNEVTLNGLNCNSPKQCKEALGTDSTDKLTLAKLINDGNELARAIYNQRRNLKKLALLQNYNFDRVYTRFNVAGAATGRFTSTGGDIPNGINSQQIPRDLQYLFRPTEKDMVIVEADYSTLELRLAAEIFGDVYMNQQLREGKDLHTEMAKAMCGRDEITKEERTRAKAINFGFVYGMSAESFKEYALLNYGVTMDIEEAKRLRNLYFTNYPHIAKVHKAIWSNYSKPGYTYTTALGREVKPKLGTDAINGPIQGSGAECTKLAVIALITKLRNRGIDAKIINVVHDSIKIECAKSLSLVVASALEEAMQFGWNEILKRDICKFKNTPMPIEVEIH